MLAEPPHSDQATMLRLSFVFIGVALAMILVTAIGCQQPPATSPTVATQQNRVRSSPTLIAPKLSKPTPPTITRQSTVGLSPKQYRWNFSDSPRDWKYIVIHHTATDKGSVAGIHQSHLRRKDAAGNPWRGIGYHFVIGNGHGMDDGEVESTFRWDEQTNGAHAGVGEYNNTGIGICLVGNFEEHAPTPNQMASLKTLIAELQERFKIDSKNIIGHSDVKSTKCPGKHFSFDEITSTLNEH